MMLSFDLPAVLLLLPIPLVLCLYHLNNKKSARQNQTAVVHPKAELLASLMHTRQATLPWLWLLGCIMLIFALARPQWSDIDMPANYSSHSIMLAIDTSESMRAEDYNLLNQKTSRLELIKSIANDFTEHRSGDYMGLVIFADYPYVYSPLTLDLNSINQFTREIEPGIVGDQTALGDAIVLASEQLNAGNSQSKILIIFSDGHHNIGTSSLPDAIAFAHKSNIRIYTIGVGHAGPVPFPRGPILKPITADFPMDLDALKNIATNTGGLFFYANDSQQINTIIDNIIQSEPTKLKLANQRIRHDIYWLPLVIGIALLFSYEYMPRRRIIP